jgi:hypothetical protein
VLPNKKKGRKKKRRQIIASAGKHVEKSEPSCVRDLVPYTAWSEVWLVGHDWIVRVLTSWINFLMD